MSESTYKLLLIGDSGTGKSSLLMRFTSDTFLEDEMASTIGVDFKVKYWSPVNDPSQRIKLNVFDTAGQERFRTLTSSYYRGAHGVILVYDVTSQDSFDSLRETWLPELDTFSSPSQPNIKMIIGNKIDKQPQVVSRQQGAQFAKENGALFLECSAKTKVGVEQAFDELCQKILQTPSVSQAQQKQGGLKVNAAPEEIDLCAC